MVIFILGGTLLILGAVATLCHGTILYLLTILYSTSYDLFANKTADGGYMNLSTSQRSLSDECIEY